MSVFDFFLFVQNIFNLHTHKNKSIFQRFISKSVRFYSFSYVSNVFLDMWTHSLGLYITIRLEEKKKKKQKRK